MAEFNNADPWRPEIPRQASLVRLVFDFRTGQFLRGRGHAIWTAENGGKRLRETLVFAGHEATWETGWRTTPGGGITIVDAKGEPLVDLSPPLHRAQACHLCGADRYQARFSWHRDRSEFHLAWRVIGPAKNYAMVTRYNWGEDLR